MKLTARKRIENQSQQMSIPSRFHSAVVATLLAAALITPRPAGAGQRRFTYSYETLTAPQGSLEFENWVTFKRSPLHDRDLDAWEFRHEIEYGVTSRFQLAVYVADWDFAPRSAGEDAKPHRSARYSHSGVELIYNVSNPNTDWIGSALYFEALAGDRLLEVEGKALLQKNFGPLTVVYNAILEAVWEGAHLDEQKGEFSQTLGVSYQLHPAVSVGGELLHEIEIPEWNRSRAERAAVFLGPNVSFHRNHIYATLTALWRATDNHGEPDLQTRLIFGLDF